MPFEKAAHGSPPRARVAIVPLLLVASIYGPPYAQTRQQFGERGPDEVRPSAPCPRDYLRVPQENVLARPHRMPARRQTNAASFRD